MAVSAYRAAQQAEQERLVGELVARFGLEPGSANHRRAVRFASANLNDSPYAYPAPTHVKARYQREIDKLEINSQLSKRTALADTLERLVTRHTLGRGDWDREEKLYGKLALLLHLSVGVLHHTPESDAQVAAHREHAAEAVALDGRTDSYADQLRALACEWNEGGSHGDGDTDDDLSDWSAESDREEEPACKNGGGHKAAPAVLDEDRRGRAPQAGEAHAQRATGLQASAHSAGHGMSPLAYHLPPGLHACAVDPHNPCHLAMACAQQEASADDASLRLWRMQHLVAHEEAVVREVLDMLCGSEGRLFGTRVPSHGGHDAGDDGLGSSHIDARPGAGVSRLGASDSRSSRRSEFHLRQPIALLHLSPQVHACPRPQLLLLPLLLLLLLLLLSSGAPSASNPLTASSS